MYVILFLISNLNIISPYLQINFSALAKKYGVSEKTKVGNMVVKEFLRKNGVNVEMFKPFRRNSPLPRRQLKKTFGGEITTPVPRTSAAIRETLRKKIANGEYRLGEIVAPKTYQKLTLDSDGTLKKECFTVSGRKIPLLEIRKNLLAEHEEMGLVRDHSEAHYEAMTYEELEIRLKEIGEFKEGPDGDRTREELVNSLKHWERTRHLMIWSDHSSVMNHGHILLTVNAIYDPAFYYTSQELGGKDVQEMVEKPQIYLMARCRDTIEDQLLYSDTRLEDIQQLTAKITSSHKVFITEICRMFHGDHPSQEVESGEQLGGNYGCCGCTISSTQYFDHIASLRAPQITLEERRKKVIAGPAGKERRNGGVQPFQQMSKDDMIRECKGRNLPTDGLLKPALQSQLREELKGIQRVPALCFPDQSASMKDLNLTQYEVVPVEPLHDLKEHINNILKELPKHLTNEEKPLFEEAIEAVLSTKEKLRGADYRLCCIVLALHLGSNCRLTIRRLLYSLAELCELLYAPSDKRTPRFILRLHNVTFCHVVAVRKVFNTTEILTRRKLYGIYYHSITCHAPFTSRLISLSSVDTEEEEREFSTINAISKTTSNGHPEHIIPNCIVHAQAERNFKSTKSSFLEQQSKIRKFASNLPQFPDTVIPHELLDSELYQAHLETISDFLLCGKGVWWHVNEDSKEIVFHDGKGWPEFQEQGPPLHHFRSSSFESEGSYLKKKWEECLSKGNLNLPIRKVKVYNTDGYLAYTDYYRVFRDEEWPEPLEDNIPEENQTDAENQIALPLPGDQEGLKEQDESHALITSLVYTPINDDAAELSEDDCNDVDDDHGTGKEGSLATANDHHINLPGVPPATNLQDASNAADNDVHQQAQKDPKLTEMDKNQQEGNILQTKLAMSVAKVIGTTPLVKTLDKAKKALHEKQNRNNKYCYDKYKDTLACVQTQVLAAHKRLSLEIEQWEKEFLLKHGFAPTYENYEQEEEIKAAYKKKKLSKELLKHWKITVHIYPLS